MSNEKDDKAIFDLLLEWGTIGTTDTFRERVVEYVAEVRREEREAVWEAGFKELCYDCAEGDLPTLDQKAQWYYHGEGKHEVGCSASKLRLAAALEAAANEGKD